MRGCIPIVTCWQDNIVYVHDMWGCIPIVTYVGKTTLYMYMMCGDIYLPTVNSVGDEVKQTIDILLYLVLWF